MVNRYKLCLVTAALCIAPLIHGCGGNNADQSATPPAPAGPPGAAANSAPANGASTAPAANGASTGNGATASAANGASATNADLDFAIKNDTNGTVKDVFVSATGKKDWGDGLLKTPLKKSDTFNVKFSPKATADTWDIRVEWADDNTASEFREVTLSGMTDLVLESENGKRTAKMMNGSDIVKTVDAGPVD